jgi:hypothetical protein
MVDAIAKVADGAWMMFRMIHSGNRKDTIGSFYRSMLIPFDGPFINKLVYPIAIPCT